MSGTGGVADRQSGARFTCPERPTLMWQDGGRGNRCWRVGQRLFRSCELEAAGQGGLLTGEAGRGAPCVRGWRGKNRRRPPPTGTARLTAPRRRRSSFRPPWAWPFMVAREDNLCRKLLVFLCVFFPACGWGQPQRINGFYYFTYHFCLEDYWIGMPS